MSAAAVSHSRLKALKDAPNMNRSQQRRIRGLAKQISFLTLFGAFCICLMLYVVATFGRRKRYNNVYVHSQFLVVKMCVSPSCKNYSKLYWLKELNYCT